MSHWSGMSREKPCRVLRFATEHTAKQHQRYIKNTLGFNREVYECYKCGLWHVGRGENVTKTVVS